MPESRLIEPPRELAHVPASVLLWGPNRDTLDLVAFGLAQRIDPEFSWLDVPRMDPWGDGPTVFSTLPDHRRRSIRFPEEVLPDPRAVNLSMFVGLRGDDSRESNRAADVLALPEPLRDLLGRLPPGRELAALVVTNADRLPLTEPKADEEIRRVLETLKRERTSVVVTFKSYGPPTDRARGVFDLVYHLRASASEKSGYGTIEAERRRFPSQILVEVPVPLERTAVFVEGIAAARGGGILGVSRFGADRAHPTASGAASRRLSGIPT